MLKTVYDANVAIENYDFKKLVEVENQTIQILTIKFAGRDESGFKYWGLCKYPEDIENKNFFRLMFPVAFNRLVNEAINKKHLLELRICLMNLLSGRLSRPLYL